MENKNDYEARIAQEEMYWGEFEADANRHGVPWWCDLRMATKLTKVVSGWMYDPKIEWILRGNCKAKLIAIASGVKGNALDLGCGAGWLSLELARRGMRVDGFEISDARLNIAKEYLRNNIFKEGFGFVNYQREDINKVSLKKNNYESAASWDTLHHIPEIERVIKEICESLKPGGYFVLYDHIGLSKRNKMVIRILRIPFAVCSMARNIFKTRKDNAGLNPAPDSPVENITSPFEDITQEEMISAIKKFFEIDSLKTQLCFAGDLANELVNFPDALKYPLLRLFKFIDDVLIMARILKGEYVFVAARKSGER